MTTIPDYNTRSPKRKNRSGQIAGAVFSTLILVVGLVLLLTNLGYMPVALKRIIISWQMLLIVIGISSLVKRHWFGGLLLLSVGGFFMYPLLSAGYPEVFGMAAISIRQYWPLLLILVGLASIIHLLSPKKKSKSCCRGRRMRPIDELREGDSSSYVDKDIAFSSGEHIVLSHNFKGGKFSVAFGELRIDLRRATPSPEGCVLNVDVAFGSVVIYVPDSWDVNLQMSSVFGGFDDHRLSPVKGDGSPVVTIKGSIFMAGGELR